MSALWFVARASAVTAINRTSHGFAGYQVNSGGDTGFTLTSTFVVPKLRCGSAETATTPSVGIYTAAGFTSAGLFVGCFHGKARYWPSLVINGKPSNYTSAPARVGDVIVVTASESRTKASASVVDKTRKVKRALTGGGQSQSSFPWIGDSSWNNNAGQPFGVPVFGKLRFTHSKVNGTPLGSLPGSPNAPSLFRFKRVTTSGALQIAVGSVSGATFTTSFKRS